MTRRYIAQNPSRPFSDAVLLDEKSLYISGRIGLKPGTEEVPESGEEEAHILMRDFVQVLELAGMTTNDLVSVQVFSPDVSLWAQFNAVYRQYFSGILPPRAFLGSGPLLFGAHFEMMGVAIKD
jgi:enamine deaminase RidA (YjgF/YER057c/UK114 family)